MAHEHSVALNRLRHALQEAIRKGMAKASLARSVGISRSHLDSIINGPTVPSVDLAEQLAIAIGHRFEISPSENLSKSS